MAVGSNQGRVHDQRQGTGLATQLGRSRATNVLEGQVNKLSALRAKERQAVDRTKAEKAKQLSKSRAKFAEVPEFFFKHKKYFQDAFDPLTEKFAKIMQDGRDPFGDYSDDSLAFQKEYNRLMTASKFSTQIQKEYESGTKKYDPSKHSVLSYNGFIDHFDKNSLEDLMKDPRSAPRFEMDRPKLTYNGYVDDIVGNFLDKNKKKSLTQEDVDLLVREVGQDPNILDELVPMIEGMYDQGYITEDSWGEYGGLIDGDGKGFTDVNTLDVTKSKLRESLESRMQGSVSESAINPVTHISDQLDLSDYSNEDGAVTTSGTSSTKSKQTIRALVGSEYLYNKDFKGTLDSQMRGNDTYDAMSNQERSEFWESNKDFIDEVYAAKGGKKSKRSLDESSVGGRGSKEYDESFNDWKRDMMNNENGSTGYGYGNDLADGTQYRGMAVKKTSAGVPPIDFITFTPERWNIDSNNVADKKKDPVPVSFKIDDTEGIDNYLESFYGQLHNKTKTHYGASRTGKKLSDDSGKKLKNNSGGFDFSTIGG